MFSAMCSELLYNNAISSGEKTRTPPPLVSTAASA